MFAEARHSQTKLAATIQMLARPQKEADEAVELQGLPREEQIARISAMPEVQQAAAIDANFSPLLRMGVKAEIAKQKQLESAPSTTPAGATELTEGGGADAAAE